jgi:hypothetical protein
VGDIIGMSQNFEANENLGGPVGSKPSKSEISDIRGSPTGEKWNSRSHPLIRRAGAGLTYGWKMAPAPVGSDIHRISTPVGKIAIPRYSYGAHNSWESFGI